MATAVVEAQSYTLIRGPMSATFTVRDGCVTLTHRSKWATTVRALTVEQARDRYRELLKDGYERF